MKSFQQFELLKVIIERAIQLVEFVPQIIYPFLQLVIPVREYIIPVLLMSQLINSIHSSTNEPYQKNSRPPDHSYTRV